MPTSQRHPWKPTPNALNLGRSKCLHNSYPLWKLSHQFHKLRRCVYTRQHSFACSATKGNRKTNYRSPANLEEHMEWISNSPYGRWLRRRRMDAEQHAEDNPDLPNHWVCPYCPADAEIWPTCDDLIDHLKGSNVESTSVKH